MWHSVNESLSNLCSSPFWDTNVTWNSPDPEFTTCFEKTVLTWFPCLFLWLFLPAEIYHLRHTKSYNIPFNYRNITKLAFIGILETLALTDIGNYILVAKHNSVEIYSSVIKFVTFCLFFILTYANIRSGVRSSGVLFVFSFLLVVSGAPQFRTELRSRSNLISYLIGSSLNAHSVTSYEIVDFVSYISYYSSALVILFLNCFADERPIKAFSADKNVCPEYESSFLSQIFFAWFDAFAWKGFRRPLKDEDLWTLDYELQSATVVDKFESKWYPALQRFKKKTEGVGTMVRYECEKLLGTGTKRETVDLAPSRHKAGEMKPKQATVFPALCETFGLYFMLGVVLKLAVDCLTFVSPQILKAIIAFVGNKDEYLWRGYFYAVLLFAVASLQTLLSSQVLHVMFRTGLLIRTALVSVIYKKALKISNGARRDFTLGEIINLMAVDTQRFVDLTTSINVLWSAPLQIFLAVYFLWKTLGASVLAGLAMMIFLVPVNGLIVNRAKTLQAKQMKNKDERVKLMNEILSGIKILKLYAWEPSFQKQIARIRDKECNVLRDTAYLNATSSFIWACAPFLVSLATFAVYVLSSDDHVLDAETAFVSLSLFNILKFPLSQLPVLITNIVQLTYLDVKSSVYLSLVLFTLGHHSKPHFLTLDQIYSNSHKTTISVKRINKFLNSEELDPDAVSHEIRPEPIVVENGQFSWEGYEDSPTLRDINVNVKPGSLVAVVGPVGSGKSSLLSAVLGEMYKQSGFVNTLGRLAYVPQQAWMQNSTFKDNITLGDTTKRSFYKKVLEACALSADLKILPGGDQTEIGEKGINLSGGQKQRISLARAVFTEADVYLLDDPLSAVDAHVGKHIFERVIGPNGLLKKTTRILVTHNVTYLPQVDFIIVLGNGTISESGTYNELIQKKGDFAEFIATYLKEDSNDSDADADTGEKDDTILSEDNSSQRRSRTKSESASIYSRQRSTSGSEAGRRESEVIGQKLVDTEVAETGNIKWKVYAYYFSAVGSFFVTVTILMSVLFQAFSMASNYWLSVWTSDTSAVENGHQNIAKRNLYLSVYGLLGVGQAIFVVLQNVALYLGALKASVHLHNYILERVLHFPMTYFDKTPVGRILNRFSYDINVCDDSLPRSQSQSLRHWSTVVTTLFIISYSTPLVIIIIVPMGAIYYFVQRFYVATTRQLKRLESVSRSPIFSHFGESVSGVQSVRAYGLQEKFIQVFQYKVDYNQKSYYTGLVANRWLSVRLEVVGNLIIFFSALFTVLGRDTLSAGLVGLSVSYALQITQTLNWLVRNTSEVETNIVAVERIKEYDEIELEAPWQVPDKRVPAGWPSSGDIAFERLQVQYREGLEPVLKGITFYVKGGEKIGIVGRTGAGKSSLTLSLFRIIEPKSGRILIDDVDVSKIGLHTLRGRLTIIPQDPVLFSGSLRINLDPTEEHSDERIWRALELADLKAYVSSLNFGLQYEVTEGGDNFSVGQRQLICLARALLRKTKVLIMDEATAAVDLETDDLIQATIRKEFKDCTVLTIAHRLNTILDYDRIIVLDKGHVVEFDSPSALLKSKRSIFYAMAADANLV